MRRLTRVIILLCCLPMLIKCKGNFSDRLNSRADRANSVRGEDVKGRPDKLSEEPAGLPGYPLVCRWQDVPREPTTANIKCFHTNESGNPIDLGTDVLWVVENPLPEVTVVQKVVGLEFHISISGSTSAIVLDALSIMQVHVKYGPEKSVEKKAPIRDLLETSYPAPNGTVSPSPAAVLRLSHANTLCLQVTLLGSVSLQPCLQTEELQKFKEVVASDRRIQYLNEKTQFCLSSAGGAFADYIISADPCTQDETQYFTKVAADTLFSLRQDSFALCMSAQNAGSLANTKIVLAVCANETSQQFVP